MLLSEIQQYIGRTISLSTTFVVIVFLLRFFIIEPGIVNGQSMEPQYRDEQFFLVNKIVYLLRPPQRYDVVQLFNTQTEDFLIKRIIGLPGETVSIKYDGVYIQTASGETMRLAEEYLEDDVYTTVQPGQSVSVTVPEHMYYVLGDNRQHSHDSRDFGSVHRRTIQGKVMTL